AASTCRCWTPVHRRTTSDNWVRPATGTWTSSAGVRLLRLRSGVVDDVERFGEVVDDGIGGLRGAARHVRLRMRAAPVVERDDAAVEGRPLVRAHAELRAHAAGDRHEEAAGGALATGLAGELAVRSGVGGRPPLCGVRDPLARQDARPAQTELEVRDLVDVLARLRVDLLEAQVQVRV